MLIRPLLVYLCLVTLLGGCELLPSGKSEEPTEVTPTVAPPPPAEFDSIRFDAGSTELTLRARQQLREIASVLRHPAYESRGIVVEGHTDSSGAPGRNLTVSRRRAESVAPELVFNGISRARVRVEARGEDSPVMVETPGQPATEDRAASRRVEIRLDE